ncbi:MAG: ATPase, T2SS/T4P/T4SS family [Thermoleophilia bacterium]
MPGQSADRVVAVISDDRELRDELASVLAEVFVVSPMPAAPEAVEALQLAPPAALVLDLDVTSADAFDLLARIGNASRLRDVPVVALSGSNDFSTFEHAHRFDIAAYVTKPLSPSELSMRLQELTSPATHPINSRLKLGAMLVASGMLTAGQVEEALRRQRDTGGRLGEVLVTEGKATEQQIVAVVARQMRIGVVDLSLTVPHASAIGLLPRDFIVRNRLIPLQINDDESLQLAMTNPLDVITIDEVSMRTNRRVVPLICTQSGFDEAVAIYFSSRGKLKDQRDEGQEVVEAPTAVDANAIEIVDALLTDATNMGASDIHLEPREDTLHIRCRIDGVLHELREFSRELQPGILSRLKIMANLNIAERRLPQDGRTSFELTSGEVVDLRLASIPSLYGENITVRILEVAPLPPTLNSLGLTGANLARFEAALARPEGGIAIVGPTGSGKSTTLYTTLELTRSPERKVYTVEDPIERKIAGIVQIEVNTVVGLTFARALRSLVRADPDVIMVGEVRDLETAKMAADAAITGHKVFTTLHTNDAPSAITRLVEMGLPRYLVAAAWDCYVAQRLTRRLCVHCRAPEEISAARWRELGLGEPPAAHLTIYNPVGCGKCFGTGYRGRIGLYEVLTIDDELRDLISADGTLLDIQRMARAKGVQSLRDDGIRKVLDGTTSYLELMRVTI